jgi:pre-rRNA-processing protein TSR3
MFHMTNLHSTLIIRHKKENKKKCSLRGLENREDLLFKQYPIKEPLPLEGAFLLSFEGPALSPEDQDHPLVLLDGTWRYAEQMYRNIPELASLPKRSLPKKFVTAYPRKQDDCSDPQRGLASVEALAIANYLRGLPWLDLLDHYHWREQFLEKNFIPNSPYANDGQMETQASSHEREEAKRSRGGHGVTMADERSSL